MNLQLSSAVEQALRDKTPIVALESTVYSHLGLPSPHNSDALHRSLDIIEKEGATPAVTAILDGVARCGLEADEYERILGPAVKVAERDLSVAIGQKIAVGATTVSASLALAQLGGVRVFATGGIGGVHRGANETFDISADLGAIARHDVATVSAGVKSFLDIAATLERLETLGAPVLGWQTSTFPAFTARSSSCAVHHRIDTLEELASIVEARLQQGGGLLIANPVPVADALNQTLHDRALEEALQAAEAAGISGPALTPFVLEAIVDATGGESVSANVSLLENNCRLAAMLAATIA